MEEKRILKDLLSLVSKDSEEVTNLLFAKFGTLREIVEADAYTLSEALGDHGRLAFYIRIVNALASRSVTDSFKFGKKHANEEIEEYLKALFLGASVEMVYLMSLDKDGRVIACDYAGEGTVNFSGIFPRKLLEIGIKRKAASVIIAHNHPGGYPKPSEEDEESTKLLCHMFLSSNITMEAHYVVAGLDLFRIEPQKQLKGTEYENT